MATRDETGDVFPSIDVMARIDEPAADVARRVREWLRAIPSEEMSGFTLLFDVAPAGAIDGRTTLLLTGSEDTG